MDASEIYSKRLNAKEVIFPKQGEFIFPIADGRIKTPGGDQELRTSTLVRHRPTQGESNIDFLGESEGSLPPPQDSLPDAGEAINDFWTMSGNFIYRHHVEPRVKLYSPREESFPIPLKYIDVSSWVRLTKRQATSRPDHSWPELWRGMSKNAKLREKQKWSNEKPNLDNARRSRGIYFIDPEDKEFKETIRNARKIGNTNGSRHVA